MINKRHKIFVASIQIILTITLVSFTSCRENILTNDNSIGNINEPVKIKTFESYTFEINASKITFNETDKTQLNITKADVITSVSEYSSGIVSITVVGDNLQNLYTSSFTENRTGEMGTIINHVPEKVKIEFNNFTGKLKVRINKSN